MNHSLRAGVLVACLNDLWHDNGDVLSPSVGGPRIGMIYTVVHVEANRFYPNVTMLQLAELASLGLFSFNRVLPPHEPLWRIVTKPSIACLRSLLVRSPLSTGVEFV